MVLPGYGLCRSLWLSMEVALAAYAVRGGPLLAGLLLFGSWMNVQIFMLLCLTDDACGQSGWVRSSCPSVLGGAYAGLCLAVHASICLIS